MSGPIIAELNRIKRLAEAKKVHQTLEPQKVSISELPFDPTIGAEQLAHAKQRIRDQRHQLVHLEGHLAVLNDAMAQRQDILDYVKQMILHDAVFMSCIPDDSKRAEYQRSFLSVLDGDHLHGMSTAVERGLLEEQLNGLRDRVRILDARDATKSKTIKEKDQRANSIAAERDELLLQISKSKNQYTNLYKVLQETKEDLTGSRDSVSQIKREADMLRKTLDGALVDLKNKEQQLATAQALSQSLQGQLDAMSNQSDADKRAAAEAMKSVAPLSLEIARSADQASNAKFGTPLWSTYMQLASDTLDKLATVLHAASGNAAAEQLKNVVKAVSQFHSMSRTAFDVVTAQESNRSAQESDWSMACEVKAALVSPAMSDVTLSRAKGLLAQLGASSPCSFAPAEKLFQSMMRLCDGMIAGWDKCIAAHDAETASLRKELQDASTLPPPVEAPPLLSPAEGPVTELLADIKSTLDASNAKWFSPAVKSWSDDFDSTIGAVVQHLAQYRSLEKPPMLPMKAVEGVMDVVGRIVSHIKAGKREVLRRNQLAEEKELLASRESSPLPVHHPQSDPSLPTLLQECHEAVQAVHAAQAASQASGDGEQYISTRKALHDAIRKAVDCCDGATSVGDVTVKAQQLLTSCLRCLDVSFGETECMWNAIVAIDDPIVAQCIKSGHISSKLGGSWSRILPPVMAADKQRTKNGSTSLGRFSEPPPPAQTRVEKPLTPQVARTHNSSQTMPDKAPKPPTVEQAIEMIKKAGMWPASPTQMPRTVGSDESIQATSMATRRGTQTPFTGPPREDVSTMTDAALLTQYFGVSSGAGTKAPAPRQRSASIVQVFGASGELEEVGSIRADEQAPLFRTASSIPTKHRSSVDLTVSATQSHSFARKHSISSLLARERKISVQQDNDDDSVESVVYGSDFADFAPQEAPRNQGRRPSSTRVFTADFGDTPVEAPSDFYALLGRRPSSAAERPSSALARVPSTKSITLRERSEEVRQIAGAIGNRRPSALNQRNQKIHEVILGGESSSPVMTADTRRKSLRELAATQRHMTAILQDAVSER